MGAAVRLVVGGSQHLYTLLFAVGSLLLVVLVPYSRYISVPEVADLLAVRLCRRGFHRRHRLARGGDRRGGATLSGDSLTLIVAIFGTTISPYLFFWQSSQEVEDKEADPKARPLLERPRRAKRELYRIGMETWIGMGASNLVAFFIILTTAVTLHASGHTDIQTSEQAAAALKPIAGEYAFLLFSLGIIGTGLLAVPVLAGSAAYAVGELRGWRTGLEHRPNQAKGFYGIIGIAILLGVAVDLSPLDPIKALFWSAVVNGVITVPILVAVMIVVSRQQQMGKFIATTSVIGWATVAMMAVAAVAMFVLM
jgi:Mn2+/Fe2+ NRAMP family transporter